MIVRRIAVALCLSVVAAPVFAQQRTTTSTTTQSTERTQAPAATTTPAAAATAPAPVVKVLPVNVRVDLDITEKNGTAAPIKRSATIVTGDGLNGSIRSNTNLNGMANVSPLSVDAHPMVLPDGKVRLTLNLNYETPPPAQDQKTRDYSRANLIEALQLVLADGVRVVAAESPGAVGDVQFTVEVKATILK
jgi:hypothetical protein